MERAPRGRSRASPPNKSLAPFRALAAWHLFARLPLAGISSPIFRRIGTPTSWERGRKRTARRRGEMSVGGVLDRRSRCVGRDGDGLLDVIGASRYRHHRDRDPPVEIPGTDRNGGFLGRCSRAVSDLAVLVVAPGEELTRGGDDKRVPAPSGGIDGAGDIRHRLGPLPRAPPARALPAVSSSRWRESHQRSILRKTQEPFRTQGPSTHP